MAPGGQRLLLTTAQTYPSISRVAQPYLKLAGVRLEPKNRSRHDTPGGYGIPACVADFTLVDIGSGKETKVNLPQGCATGALWSADGSHFAFQNAIDTSVQLWVGDAATGQVKQVPNVQLNPIFGYTVQWLGGSQNLLVKLVPANQGPAPSNGGVPTGPDAQESLGSSGESSTYEARDTLTSVHDEKLFAYYGASQLAVVDTAANSVRPVGQPALFNEVSAAPDGVHVLTESIKAPYSHAVTYQRFANDVAVLDIASGKSTKIASLPLADRVPVHGVPEGPRGFDWRATDPATLVYAEALDKGDWKVNVPHRDRVLMLKAPFNGKPTEITRTAQRLRASRGPPIRPWRSSTRTTRTATGCRPASSMWTSRRRKAACCGTCPATSCMATPATWSLPACRMARRWCAVRATMCSSAAVARRRRATVRSWTAWTWAP